jgi:hypothetical protein
VFHLSQRTLQKLLVRGIVLAVVIVLGVVTK